jgi:hypothetical protein
MAPSRCNLQELLLGALLVLALTAPQTWAIQDCSPVPGNTGSGAGPVCPSTLLGAPSASNQSLFYSGTSVTIRVNSSTIVFPVIGDWGRTNSWIGALIGNPECTATNFFLGDDELFGAQCAARPDVCWAAVWLQVPPSVNVCAQYLSAAA